MSHWQHIMLFACGMVFAFPVSGMDKARAEMRVDDAVLKFGVSGRGVIVAILDRGIDWKNNDFRNPDGSTRIEYIFDLSDDTGANAPENRYRAGTIYTRQQIDRALSQGTELPTRDAVGHGTTTTGIAAGNGRNSLNGKYRGVAPNARIISVKIAGNAPAHDDQPAESVSFRVDPLQTAIDFVRDKARELGLPAVMLPNVGSVGGPTDGTSLLTRKIDSTVGPAIPGLIYVNGSGDEGGVPIHAAANVTQGQSLDLEIDKLDDGKARFDLWYPSLDRYEVTIRTSDAVVGPYRGPFANDSFEHITTPGVDYWHLGSSVTFFGALAKREILIDFTGKRGRYVVTLRGVAANGGRFDATLNQVNGRSQFLTYVVPGSSIWDGATAFNNICPNDYVVRTQWVDVNGVSRVWPGDRIGELWTGSSVGPTFDGRLGIDISAPGNTVFTTYNPKSYWATFRGNLIQDGGGLYGAANAVSAANPEVTGIVALMLEINPLLDATQVKRVLQSTARSDQFTGATPNPNWGYGKVDALAALTMVSLLPASRPYFSLDSNIISLNYSLGDANPPPKAIAIDGSPGAPAFTVSQSLPWISVDPKGGATPARITLTVNPAGLTVGDRTGTVTIASADGRAIPQTITVYLHVQNPVPTIASVVNGASFRAGFSSGSWVTIRGTNLAQTSRIWGSSDFAGDLLPSTLDGVRVSINGRAAPVYFVSSTQLNVLAPDDPFVGNVAVQVTNQLGRSNSFLAEKRAVTPEFFRFEAQAGRYIAAVHPDGILLGESGLIQGAVTRPARPGEIVLLFGTGCGPTNPPLPSNRIVAAPASARGPVRLTIGVKPADTLFVGLVSAGLCQVNATIPDLPSGDAEVILEVGGVKSSAGSFVTISVN